MKVVQAHEVPEAPVEMEGARDVTIRWLVGPDDDPPSFYLRQFEVQPGGHSPRHTHPGEHEVYILSGAGVVFTPEGERPVGPGTTVLVRPHEEHQFRNTGGAPLVFLCAVPK